MYQPGHSFWIYFLNDPKTIVRKKWNNTEERTVEHAQEKYALQHSVTEGTHLFVFILGAKILPCSGIYVKQWFGEGGSLAWVAGRRQSSHWECLNPYFQRASTHLSLHPLTTARTVHREVCSGDTVVPHTGCPTRPTHQHIWADSYSQEWSV